MIQAINTCITGLNIIGRGFWDYAAGVFIQASVLIVLLLVVDFLLRKRVRAVFRYCLWMLVFVKLVLPASLALPTGIGYWLADYVKPEISIAMFVPRIEETMPTVIDMPQAYVPSEAPVMVETAATGVELEPICWQGLVFLGWLVGMLVLLALLVQRICFVRGLIAQSKPADGRLLEMLAECRCQIGIRRDIELRLSGNTLSPAVCGLFNPIILMPAALLKELSQEKLKAILIHELAHIKRADVWVNLLQTMLQIVYFYNPFVWIANAMIRRVREQAVDEMVLVTLGPETESYSNTLIDIAEMAFWKPNFSLRLIGVVESKKALERRIKHMLNRPVPRTAKLGIVGLLTIIITASVLLPMAKGERESDFSNPVELDENGKSIITHTLYLWGSVEKPLYRLEDRTYHDANKVVARIGELMKQDVFPMIRVHTTKLFQRQQEPIEDLSNRCRNIGFINMEFKYDITLPPNTFQTILPNGVTVELVGVCEHPSEGKQWWRADGSLLEKPPYAFPPAATYS